MIKPENALRSSGDGVKRSAVEASDAESDIAIGKPGFRCMKKTLKTLPGTTGRPIFKVFFSIRAEIFVNRGVSVFAGVEFLLGHVEVKAATRV